MSKFFAKKNEQSSSSEDESAEEDVKTIQKVAGVGAKDTKKKFYGGDSDESEDGAHRVVKKTTDKRTDALKLVFEKMKNHIKIADFTTL